MKKAALAVGVLMLLTAGAAGWYLFKGRPATTPNVNAMIVRQQSKSLDPIKHDFFDADFAKKMIVHHQQGIELTDAAIATSTNPIIRELAVEIRRKQFEAEMQYKLWLEDWNEEYRNLSEFPQTDGHDLYPSYLGLVSSADLSNLKTLRADESDTMFITLMKEHHDEPLTLNEISNRLQYGKLIEFKDKVFADYKVELQEMEKV